MDSILGRLYSRSMKEYEASVEMEEGRLGVETLDVVGGCEGRAFEKAVKTETVQINMY